MKTIDATGSKYHRLTLLEKRTTPGEPSRYFCRCDCGKEFVCRWSNIQSGTAKSCGCLRREVAGSRNRLTAEQTLGTQIWNYYRRNAKMRNLAWDLTKDQFQTLIFSACHWCGILGGTQTIGHRVGPQGNHTIRNNGIDRLNNLVGYSVANCVSACKRCNLGRNDQTVSEFLSWIQRLATHQKLR